MVQSQKKSPGLLTETKILLRRHKLRQKKRYGQNFLVDDFVQRNILDTASLKRDETVLEIGAGLGALTLPMAKRAKEAMTSNTSPSRSIIAVIRPRSSPAFTASF